MLPLAAVAEALPEYQPWKVSNGGAGACAFTGRFVDSDDSYRDVIFQLTQQRPGDAPAASALFDTVKGEFAKTYTIETPAAIGTRAIGFSIGEGTYNVWTVLDAVVLSSQLIKVGAGEVKSSEQEAVNQLTKSALAVAITPAALQQASSCPYFEPTLLAKLLPGKPPKVQQFGENSCMAQSEKQDIVLITVLDASDMALSTLKSSASADCTVDPEPIAGTGYLSHGCKSGNPHIAARFINAGKMYDLSFVPEGREPSSEELGHVRALAEWMLQR
jgi:hypothetical protein